MQREIKYDRETTEYAMYLDNELIGFARTYFEAERTLDAIEAEGVQAFTSEQAAIIAEYWPTQAEHLVVKA